MSIDWILALLAAICFGLGAFRVALPRVDLMLLGFMFLTITLLV